MAFVSALLAGSLVAMGVAAALRSGEDAPTIQDAEELRAGHGAERVPVPAEGVYFGAWRGPGPGRPDDPRVSIESAEQQIGRKYAIDRRFYRWHTVLPTNYDRWTADEGRIPMISLRSRDVRTDEVIPWSVIASGREDTYLREVADGLREWREPVFFILDAEPESMVGEWGTAAEFRAAWRHIVGLFRERDVRNVSFTWTTQTWSFKPEAERGELMDDLYPGDDVVDWIAGDPYNFYDRGVWADLGEEMADWYAWARREHPTKPLAVAEWGSKEDPAAPGRKAAWFDEVLLALREDYPEVKAVVYFDEEKHEDGTVNDWRIDTSAESLLGFARLARSPYFVTPQPGSSR